MPYINAFGAALHGGPSLQKFCYIHIDNLRQKLDEECLEEKHESILNSNIFTISDADIPS